MQCTFCDAPLPGGARYCPNCGTAVIGPVPDYGAKPDPYSPHREAEPEFEPVPASSWAGGGWGRVSTSPMALLCLGFGIAAWTVLPVLGAFLAVLFGHQARREIAGSGGRLEGEGLATIGLVLGYLQVLPLLALLTLGLILMVSGMAFLPFWNMLVD